MNVIIYLIIAAWVTKAAFDVSIGMLQIIFGLMAGLIGACILLLILLLEGFVILCRTAFPNLNAPLFPASGAKAACHQANKNKFIS